MTMSGPHFLQIPGPTNVPERVLRAMGRPLIDQRGPEFSAFTLELISSIQSILNTKQEVVIFPSSGTGAWEAALVNTLSPGDRVLCFDIGQFSSMWAAMAKSFGLEVDLVESDWRRGVDSVVLAERLTDDKARAIKAVLVVHNETSTGVKSAVEDVRQAMDSSGHPALLMVDTISSLASTEYFPDKWGVDVTVAGSQKGLMMPPGLSFNLVGARALEAVNSARLPRYYWDWKPIMTMNKNGQFPYTPPISMLYGLKEAMDMLCEEGMERVFARHERLAKATRTAAEAWGLELVCEKSNEYSPTVTAIMLPDGNNADALRKIILDRWNMALGMGLGRWKERVFRIGHLGQINELMIAGTLSGVEMGLSAAGVPHKPGGVTAALEYLATTNL